MNTAAQVQPQRFRPALRLVKTNTLSRDEWLEVRKHGIGSSDAAAAVGLNPYKSQLELWMEKTGRDADLPKPDPTDTAAPVYWGTLLEPIVAASYTQQTGRKVRKVNAVLQHPERPWMLANIDREVVGASDVQILECKTAGEFGSRHWRDGVPEYVQLQVQHQLAVTGKHAADVAVLLCGQQLKVHRIERDDELIAKLMLLQERFWHYVTTDTPPPADGSDSSATALQYLYPRDSGERLDFSHDSQMSALFTDLQDVRSQLHKYKQLEEQYKQQIQQVMGDASQATFETGSITWKRSKDSTVLDTKRLLSDHPELLAQYSMIRAGSRRFLIQG
ncbi:YqaJ viral recombinase family protein [Alcaligenes nematophilus]|uniref:YqaJ viral recombinase family nuclease n=1 Tax=Alcaligenes nematophilus TaxID=2994643 RepID=UPI0024616433|nr:YqaJ viral recombinase family protein [Alcaligenes nematophilus]MDH4867566.1 YqaJ viral recombinase family protein [Bacillus cereus]MDY7128874.1 YqaJ viral recombinase family protein [Alcaligenes nematophilus]